jgi:hypothetical protein
VQRTAPRHRKTSRDPSGRTTGHARRNKPSALHSRPAKICFAAAVGAAVIAIPAKHVILSHFAPASSSTAVHQAVASAIAAGQDLQDRLGSPAPAAPRPTASRARPVPATTAPAATAPASPAPARITAPSPTPSATSQPPVYRNPLRDISGLIPERIDMGVDFGGSGPVYAIGDAVITNATSDAAGWPGGGWITYQLSDGPAAGLEVYVAEDVQPTVSVGQQVTAATVIANMFNNGDGIETGWAQPGGTSAESQLPAAGGISGGGPFPTEVGIDFEALLTTLGVPAAENAGQSGFGTLPAGYPTGWAAALEP